MAAGDDRDHRGAHASSSKTVAACSAPVPVLQRSQPLPPSRTAASSTPFQSSGAGQRGRTTASRASSSARAVASCSSCGRGWAMTTAGRLEAATSAIAFWPACVTMTSADAEQRPRVVDPAGSGRAEHRPCPPGRRALRSREHVDGQLRATAAGQDEHAPRLRRSPVATGRRPSKREIAPTAWVFACHGGAAPQHRRPGRPRRDDRVGHPVGELVGAIVARARHAHHDGRDAHRAHQDGDLDRDVDDHHARRVASPPTPRSGPCAPSGPGGRTEPSATRRRRSGRRRSPPAGRRRARAAATARASRRVAGAS